MNWAIFSTLNRTGLSALDIFLEIGLHLRISDDREASGVLSPAAQFLFQKDQNNS